MNAVQEPVAGEAAPTDENSRYYGSYYYNCCFGVPYERSDIWFRQFRWVAERIATDIAPRSVLDAGCAIGLLVETLREREIDAEGFDISEYAIGQATESIREKVRVGSILEPFGRRYDLIVTIEVLEHLKPHEAEQAIANLCAHADDVLFSSTPSDFKEASHFNVQPPEYWAELFARNGFYRDLDFDASFIARWAVRFRKGNLPAHRVAAVYERKLARLLNENHAVRESLIEHQDSLIRARAELAEAVARKEHLEVAALDYDTRIAERFAAEAALATEFHQSVKAWSEHVQALNGHMERAADEHRTTVGVWEQGLAKAENWCACVVESENDARRSELAAIQALTATRGTLESMAASRSWKLVTQVSRVRRLLSRRAGRIDGAHSTARK